MNTTPVLIGRNVSIQVAGITLDSAGAMTIASNVSLTGKAERAEMNLRRNDEDFSGLDAVGEDWHPVNEGWDLTLSAIKRKGGTNPNPLMELFMAYNYARVTITTPSHVWVFYGSLPTHGWPIERGRNVDTLTIKRIEVDGVNNPTRTAV